MNSVCVMIFWGILYPMDLLKNNRGQWKTENGVKLHTPTIWLLNLVYTSNWHEMKVQNACIATVLKSSWPSLVSLVCFIENLVCVYINLSVLSFTSIMQMNFVLVEGTV